MRVFISYSRENETFARELREALIGWEYAVWMDIFDIPKGSYWTDVITEGMKTSDVVIGILSPAGLASRNVKNEWDWALANQRPLLLLLLENCDIPPHYISINYIDLITDRDRGLQALQQALKEPHTIYVSAAPPQHIGHTITRPERERRLLDRVDRYWIKGVLERSLYSQIAIQLGIEAYMDTPWEKTAHHRAFGDYALTSQANVAKVFNDLDRAMLILGEPGAGKTTTLLEIARDLIRLAEEDASQRIPVVLQLASWSDQHPTLIDWLIEELNIKYQIPRTTAAEWVETDKLILLLDGLDEVNIEARARCVDAINAFRQEHGFSDILVCSRIQDYTTLETRLNLVGAVILQPLRPEQIDSYLAQFEPKMAALRQGIVQNTGLQEIASTPLILSIMMLAFETTPVEQLPAPDSARAWLEYTFNVYINQMFERREQSSLYSKEDSLRWLEWLAQKMRQSSQSEFYMDRVDPMWLDSALLRRVVQATTWLIFGALAGLTLWMAIAIGFDMPRNTRLVLDPILTVPTAVGIWLAVWVASGLVVRRITPDQIEVVASRRWSMRRLRDGLKEGWLTGVAWGAATGIFASGVGLIIALIGFYGLDLDLYFVGLVAFGLASVVFGVSLGYVFLKRSGFGLLGGVVAGLVGGICFGFTADFFATRFFPLEELLGDFRPLATGLACGVSIGLGSGVAKGFGYALAHGLNIERRDNIQKVLIGATLKQSIQNIRMFGLLYTAIGTVSGVIVTSIVILIVRAAGGYTVDAVFGIPIPIVIGFAAGVVFFLAAAQEFGGLLIVRRVLLHLILFFQDHMPWNYTDFLDYAAEHGLLHKVGIGYRFFHDLFRQHLADGHARPQSSTQA